MVSNAKEIQFRELKDQIAQQNITISALTDTIKTLQETLEKNRLLLEEKTANEKVLLEQIDFLTKKLFGSSSESRSKEFPGQYYLFDEAETEQDTSALEEETTTVKEHSRKKKNSHKDTFKGLPVEKILIPLPEEEKICPVCGTELEKVGEEYIRRELEYIPATCKVIEYYSETYGCPSCKEGLGDTEKPVMIKSTVPPALIGKSFASASAAAWAMYQKYANALPLYHQEKDWAQYGAKISRTTLANWIIYCAQNYFQPMYDYFHRELLKRSFAMADETRIQVLNEENRKAQTQSFMWLFRSGEDGLPTIILYGYTPTRSGDHAKEFLKGYSGYLETDGYQGYSKLPNIKRCSCWAHIRRYFIDAVPKGKEYDYTQPAVQGVQYCNKLFAIEDRINQKYPGDYEKRKQIRLEKAQPVLEAFWLWLERQTPTRNSRMAKAVTYAMNRKDTAVTYLEDGRCSFTNNLSENAIRPFTVGRKN